MKLPFALPIVAAVVQLSIGRDNHAQTRIPALAVTPQALPVVAEVVKFCVRRHFHFHAGGVREPKALLAIKTVSKSLLHHVRLQIGVATYTSVREICP